MMNLKIQILREGEISSTVPFDEAAKKVIWKNKFLNKQYSVGA